MIRGPPRPTRFPSPTLFRPATLEKHDPRRERLREILVEEHLPLVRHFARRFSNRGEPFDDLLQVGTLGLIAAIDRFDPTRSEEHTSELQSRQYLVCRLLLEK